MHEEIGQRIKRLRQELKITQTQIYEMCGISSGNLSSIENGKSLPSSTALMQLSSILHCTVDYILFGDEGNTDALSSSGQTMDSLSAKEHQLLSIYRRLSSYDQEELFMLAQWKEEHNMGYF